MKTGVRVIILILFIVSSLFIIKLNTGEKTIEEALYKSNPKKINILHEEKTDKGIIVFYNHSGEGDFSAAFIKKEIGGYKVLYSGTTGDIQTVLDKRGLSYSYFPAIEKTSLPIYFGLIDNSIEKVRIIEKKRNIESQGKIINAKGKKIWLVDMKGFEGSNFEIIGLSADDEELVRIDDNITPYYADQKPLKSPYK